MSPSVSSPSSLFQNLNIGRDTSTHEADANISTHASTNAVTGEKPLGLGIEEDPPGDPPYSHLIYEALKGAPEKKLPLQGIYGWFQKNTSKGKDKNSKGWQNSIRHNLSMNAVRTYLLSFYTFFLFLPLL